MLIHFRNPVFAPVPLAISELDAESIFRVLCIETLPKRRMVIHGEPFESALAHFCDDLRRLVFRLLALLENDSLNLVGRFGACAYKFCLPVPRGCRRVR